MVVVHGSACVRAWKLLLPGHRIHLVPLHLLTLFVSLSLYPSSLSIHSFFSYSALFFSRLTCRARPFIHQIDLTATPSPARILRSLS